MTLTLNQRSSSDQVPNFMTLTEEVIGGLVIKKTRLHRCKAGFGCSWISYRVFVGFLLVLEREAVELAAKLKRHGDLVDFVTLCPNLEVVSLLDREADGDIVIRTIRLKNH